MRVNCCTNDKKCNVGRANVGHKSRLLQSQDSCKWRSESRVTRSSVPSVCLLRAQSVAMALQHDVRSQLRANVETLVAQDIQAKRCEALFHIPAAAISRKYLQDARDEPALQLVLNVLCTTVPAAVVIAAGCDSHAVGATYMLINYALYLQRFMLTLHVTQHRRLFRNESGKHLLCVAPGCVHFRLIC